MPVKHNSLADGIEMLHIRQYCSRVAHMAVFDSDTVRGKSVKNGKIIVVLKIGESLF